MATSRAARAIPHGVWVLGAVSLLMDVSSEMIHALLPLYLTVSLGASALTVGIIEGVAESTALIVKVFSGTLSDRWHSRKSLTAFGYGLAALSKPLFALATTPVLVFVARFVDRIGKGIRGAPRDALIADITPPQVRGAAFGLRQSLDTVGAFAGPLLAMALMLAWNDDFRAVFWIAVIPAMLSFALVVFGVREPERVQDAGDAKPVAWREAFHLGPAYWAIVMLAVALTLARFSEAFLVLRAGNLGVDAAYAPLVLVAMNVVYAVAAYPVGRLADRMPPRALLLAGIACLVAADVVLALAHQVAGFGIGVALWGLHMGFTQGLLAALVAQHAPPDRRGTAFGLFNLAMGLAMLASSAIAGALWQFAGPAATFWAGAAFAVAAGVVCAATARR
jgi:MFS family permease